MKRLPLIALLIVISSACTSSPRLTYLVAPEEKPVQELNIDIEDLEDKYGDYDGVYLEKEFTAEHAGVKDDVGKSFLGIGNKWTFSIVKRDRYVILNPEADWLTTIRLNAKPDNLFLQVIAPDGTVNNYTIADFKKEKDDYGYDDYAFVIPGVVKGTYVDFGFDYSYNVPIYSPPLEHERFLQYSIPCHKTSFSFLYPEWWNIEVKATSSGVVPHSKTILDVENKKKSLVIVKTDVPAIESEPFSPFYKEMADYVKLRIVNMEMKGVALDELTSWEQHTERFKKFALKHSDKKDRLVKEAFNQIMVGALTRRDSAMSVLRFVRDSIDANGKSKQGKAYKTLKDRAGSPYDATGLAQTLLRYGNFDAKVILVHSAADGYFDPNFFSGSQMYTLALAVFFPDDTLIALPYVRDVPLDYIPKRYQGQVALIIPDKESAFRSFITPQGSLLDNTRDEAFELNIGANGQIAVTETKTFRGDFAYHWREILRLSKKESLEKTLEDILEYQEGDVSLSDYEILNGEDDSKPLIIKLHYTIDNLITVTPEEAIFNTGGFLSPLSESQSELEKAERNNPIRIYFDREYNKTISVTFPDQWRILTPLDTISFENSIGSAQRDFTVVGSNLKINQRLNLRQVSLPAESYPDLQQLIGASSALDLKRIVFDIQPADAQEME